jgi:hypothetical protein
MYFASSLHSLLPEQQLEHELNEPVKSGRHGLGVQDAIHVFAIRLFRTAKVVFDGDCCRGAHESIVNLQMLQRASRAKMVLTWQ